MGQYQARQTHCKRGHPFAGDNLAYDNRGDRVCRTCRRITRPSRAQGWGHGTRKRYRGLNPEELLLARFIYLIDWERDGDCWPFRTATSTGGYSTISINRRHVLAHRWAYEYFIGAIPEGLTIDHLCRNPRCANPDHLEAVTMRENILRGNGRAGLNARKTVAKCGHPFTFTEPDGRRRCGPCFKEQRRAWRQSRKRAASAA